MKKNLFLLILLCAMSVIQVNAGVNPAMRREYDFKSFNAISTVSKLLLYGQCLILPSNSGHAAK